MTDLNENAFGRSIGLISTYKITYGEHGDKRIGNEPASSMRDSFFECEHEWELFEEIRIISKTYQIIRIGLFSRLSRALTTYKGTVYSTDPIVHTKVCSYER